MNAPVQQLMQFEAWPFAGLTPGAYNLLKIDPPWPTQMRSQKGEKKSSLAQYGSMSWDDIYALPIRQLAARDCVIFLWCTWPLLLNGGDPTRHSAGADARESKVGRCLYEWGARFVTGGAWRKTTVNNKVAFGTGYRLRSACEPFLIGVIGEPKTTRSERNIFDGLAREHSRKPESSYAMCDRWYPGARKAEIFSRTNRPGWDTWGFEKGKFDATVAIDGKVVA